MEKTRKERQQEERVEKFKLMTAIIVLIHSILTFIILLIK